MRILWLHLLLSFVITSQALEIGTTIQDPEVGKPYTYSLQASGGAEPYRWALVQGALPEGLALSNSGVITGTPALVQTNSFRLRVLDAAGQFAERDFTLEVEFAPGLPMSRWTGKGRDSSWHNPANWEGNALPTSDRAALVFGRAIVSNSVTVTDLYLLPGIRIEVTGPAGNIISLKDSHIDGTSLLSEKGGRIKFETLSRYSGGNAVSFGSQAVSSWLADGAGSTISLPMLTSLEGNTGGRNSHELQARNGGLIAMPALTVITNGRVDLTVLGADSQISLPQLAQLHGGLVLVRQGSQSLPKLAEMFTTSLQTEQGGLLQLPLMSRYSGGNAVSFGSQAVSSWLADGAGSTISLPMLTSLEGNTGGRNSHELWAKNGGTIGASNLSAILTGTVDVRVDDSVSTIRLGNPIVLRRTLLNGVQLGSGSRVTVQASTKPEIRGEEWKAYALEVWNQATLQWEVTRRVAMTNTVMSGSGFDSDFAGKQIRFVEYNANPSAFEIVKETSALIFYGEPGRTYQVDASSDVTSWDRSSQIILTNAFRFIPLTNRSVFKMEYFRASSLSDLASFS